MHIIILRARAKVHKNLCCESWNYAIICTAIFQTYAVHKKPDYNCMCTLHILYFLMGQLNDTQPVLL